MAGSIQNVDAEAAVLELHNRGGNGNTTLLLDLHPVGGGCTGVFLSFNNTCLSNGAAIQQEFFR